MPLSEGPAAAASLPGSSSPSVSSTGCENCREQHLKCDRVTPVCGRCQASDRLCRRAGLKIRIAKRPFHKKQKWIKTPRRLVFIDETNKVTREAQHLEGGFDVEVDFDSPNTSSAESEPQESAASALEGPRHPLASSLLATPTSPTDRFILHEDAASAQLRQGVAHHSSRSSVRELKSPNTELDELRKGLYLQVPVWPLTDPHEAFLLRNFVQNIAIWLDLCDPRRSFETVVPQLAAKCPILLNAIFALSARYLSNTGREPNPTLKRQYHDEAQEYHTLCLKSLIPVLQHHNAVVSDESLFAATIILRVLEEMEVRNRGQDIRGYLLGIKAFANPGNRFAPDTLSAASFAVGLRQEIYSAMMLKSRVENIDLDHPHIDRKLTEADEYTWANRAVVHCADVLNFCFSADGSGVTYRRWEELSEWNREWVKQRPDSFLPIFCKPVDKHGPPFAEIWHHNSCHVIGIQHHILAELFLLRFGPQGFGVRDQSSTTRILDQTRIVVGIGLGNQWTPPGMFTACMAIAAFGDLFRDRRDQEAMLEILRMTERDHARPTEAVQSQMMRSWGRQASQVSAQPGQA